MNGRGLAFVKGPPGALYPLHGRHRHGGSSATQSTGPREPKRELLDAHNWAGRDQPGLGKASADSFALAARWPGNAGRTS